MQTHETDFSKSERINLRVDRHTKDIIEYAASIDHRSLTSFIIASAKQQAERLIEQETSIHLKKREWDDFMASIASPPKANAKLKKLMRESANEQ